MGVKLLGEWGQVEVVRKWQFTGPSVKVKVLKVKIPVVEIGAHIGGKFCPPGQAKKC